MIGLQDNSNNSLLHQAIKKEIEHIAEETDLIDYCVLFESDKAEIVSNFVNDDWVWEHINQTLAELILEQIEKRRYNSDVLEEIELKLGL